MSVMASRRSFARAFFIQIDLHHGAFRDALAARRYDDEPVRPDGAAEPGLGEGGNRLDLIRTRAPHRANLGHSDRRSDLAQGPHLAPSKRKRGVATGQAPDRPAGEELIGP